MQKRNILKYIFLLYNEGQNSNTDKEKKSIISKNLVYSSPTYKSFEIRIGEGTFWNVYYGMNLRNSFPIAVKVIKDRKINIVNF